MANGRAFIDCSSSQRFRSVAKVQMKHHGYSGANENENQKSFHTNITMLSNLKYCISVTVYFKVLFYFFECDMFGKLCLKKAFALIFGFQKCLFVLKL